MLIWIMITYLLLGVMMGYMLTLSDVENGKPLPNLKEKWWLYVYILLLWPHALYKLSKKIFLDDELDLDNIDENDLTDYE